jgi:tetratricopeptide (TPR) repeat protein
MMNQERLFKLAADALARGQTDEAVDYLTQILGEDSDSAEAHALLSMALIRKKRIYAAGIEAKRALELEPESFFPHIAVASIEIATRNFSSAEKHLHVALSIDPDSAFAREKLARLYFIWDKKKEAKEQITIACELDPDDLDCMTTKSRFLYAEGDNKNAELIVREALETNPEHLDSLVLLGEILLANGDIESAKENAIWALQLDPNDESALQLLVSIKARQSFLLGLWWRFQTFISSGSRTRAIVLLIGMFLLYRASTIVLEENKLSEWTSFVSAIWIAFCIYTWVAPSIFRRKLMNELKQVELKTSF